MGRVTGDVFGARFKVDEMCSEITGLSVEAWKFV